MPASRSHVHTFTILLYFWRRGPSAHSHPHRRCCSARVVDAPGDATRTLSVPQTQRPVTLSHHIYRTHCHILVLVELHGHMGELWPTTQCDGGPRTDYMVLVVGYHVGNDRAKHAKTRQGLLLACHSRHLRGLDFAPSVTHRMKTGVLNDGPVLGSVWLHQNVDATRCVSLTCITPRAPATTC
jgi:hypothetical protein